VELFSCSKAFQLGGFRLGVALGNAEALAALEAIKVGGMSQPRGITPCNKWMVLG
jgi:histidinol-phosphate/aromatic aminotransferase/cobyric acid decarboxylase-like protein